MSCQVAHEKVITTPFPSFPALPFLVCLSLSHNIMSQPRPPTGGGGGGGRLVQHHGWDCMLQKLLFHRPCIVSKAWGRLKSCENSVLCVTQLIPLPHPAVSAPPQISQRWNLRRKI
ncbi:hypothetical protein AOLI_G00048590 [Acnodon oligacanthus]